MDQSLEEIIRAKKSARGRGGRGRGRGRGASGRGGGFRGGRGGAGGRGGFKKFRRQSDQGQEKWQHDMFQGTRRGGRGGATGRTGPVVKLMISNLDFGVSTDDIKELFTEFGRVVKAEVHYDKSGRSLGTATVVYTRVQDAQKAVAQYNNVPLDGRPMTVQIISGQQSVTNGSTGAIKQRVGQKQGGGGGGGGGSAGGRGRGGRGRGRGRGRGAKAPVPTAEELDAELDNYNKQSDTMET